MNDLEIKNGIRFAKLLPENCQYDNFKYLVIFVMILNVDVLFCRKGNYCYFSLREGERRGVTVL